MRQSLVLDAHCTSRADRSFDVFLLDISRGGCQIFTRTGLFSLGEEVFLSRNGSELQRGKVAWAEGMKSGVCFEIFLSPDTLQQLVASPSLAPRPFVVDKLTDQFGRALAPLPALSRARRFF